MAQLKATAEAINEIFFEVLIAPAFDEDALTILKKKEQDIAEIEKSGHESKDPI